MLSPLASFRADVLGGAAPLAEDDALRLPPFALHLVLAPDVRRAAFDEISGPTVDAGDSHCVVVNEVAGFNKLSRSRLRRSGGFATMLIETAPARLWGR